MNPILNYTPQVYEAIIAAFIVVGLIQSFVLRRKWKQNEEMKASIIELADEAAKIVKDVIAAATKALVSSVEVATTAIDQARRETKVVKRQAIEALKYADERLTELEAQVDDSQAAQAAQTESRLDDLEAEVSELHEAREDDKRPIPLRRGPSIRYSGDDDPFVSPLFGSVVGGAPKIQAFRLSDGGFVPVNSPADFGFEQSTFKPSDTRRGGTMSLKDILALLAAIPRPRPAQGDSVKADLSGTEMRAFLHDQFGPMAPGDDPTPAATEAEPRDTQRPVADGVESPANDPGARSAGRTPPYSRDPFSYQSPRAG